MTTTARWCVGLALLLAGGAAIWFAPRPTPPAAPVARPQPTPESAPSARAVDADRIVASLRTRAPAETAPRAIADLPVAHSWVKAHVGALLEETAVKEPLDDQEREELARLIAQYELARYSFEAQLATLRPVDPSTLRIEIPPYPEEGARLRELLFAEVARRFGADRTARLENAIADNLDFHCSEFGRTRQTITATCLRSADGEIWYQLRLEAVAVTPIENRSQPGTGRLNRTSTLTANVDRSPGNPWAPYLPAFARLTPKN